jgi:hypothetical protein
MRSSNLGSNGGYLNWGFSWFFLVLRRNFKENTSIKSQPLPCRSVLIHHPTYWRYITLMIRASYAIVYGRYGNYSDAQMFQWRVRMAFRSSLQIFISYQMRKLNVSTPLKFGLYCIVILKRKAGPFQATNENFPLYTKLFYSSSY